MFGRPSKLIDGELEPPPQVHGAAKRVELARVWAADGNAFMALRPDAMPPEAFGIMLADMARHIANATMQSSGTNSDAIYEDCLRRIKAGFDAEWQHQTSDVQGGFDK